MRFGMMVGEGSGSAPDITALCERGQLAEAAGLDTAWIANIQLDAMTGAAALASSTDRIEIGTAVVPTFTRHPVAMLQQAASTQLVCDGRFTLGVGLAHKFMVEDMWGLSYDKPAKHMRSYLEVLAPGLNGEPVNCQNDLYSVNLMVAPPVEKPIPLLIAALGPAMLRIAGELAGGTITWATGVRTLGDHIAPAISRAAESADKESPRIVAGLPVLLTANVEAARKMAAEIFAVYAQVPSYRAMLDREGAKGLEDVAIIGNEQTVKERVNSLSMAGVTDLCIFPFETEVGEIERTIRFLAETV